MLPYILLITIPAVWLFAEKYRAAGSIRGALSVDTPSTNRSLVVFFALFLALLCLRDIYVGCDLVNYRRILYCAGSDDMAAYHGMIVREIEESYASGLVIDEQRAELYQFAEKMAYEYTTFGNLEPLYTALNFALAWLSLDVRTLIVVCALLAVVPVAMYYIKETKTPLLTIVLFASVAPFTFYFSGLRQAIAMGMMIPMYYALRDKKFLRFFLFLAIAVGFHYSAVVALVLIPAMYLKITRKWMFLIGPAIVAMFIWNEPILKFILSVAGSYGQAYSNVSNNGSFGMLALFAAFVIYSYVLPYEQNMKMEDFALRNILLVCLGIQLFAPLHTNFMRIGYYYHIFIPVIIPRMAKLAHPKLKWLANLSVYVMVVFFFFYFIYNGYTSYDILQVYPYIPFWG